MNGERYYAWDSMLAFTQFYRTRREHLPVWYPAASVGDLGAAAGALNVIVAANAIARGFAPGPYVICESSSDEGLRAACVIAQAPGRRTHWSARDDSE
jgi:3-oxoacyl-[acyl-carrier-protein] synthase-1